MTMKMTSRERVLSALDRQEPDRVPADLWAEPGVWDRLVGDLGVADRDGVCEALDIDVRYVSPAYPPNMVDDGIVQNMWGERWEPIDCGYGPELQHVAGALALASTIEDLEDFPWPRCDDVDYSGLRRQIERYDGYAIFYGDADIYERPALVRGLENFLADCLINTEWVEYIQGVFEEFFTEDFARVMEATGGKIDVYYALTDLGTQDRLIVSREVMERFVFPPLRRLAEMAHREGVRFMFHSCGSVREIIPDLIDLGVDILNPIQPAAKGMAPEELKREYGDRLSFHGGIDVQYLLPHKPIAEVEHSARDTMATLGRGGGYVLAPSHNLQPDIPTENVIAMYKTELRTL